MMFGNVEGLEIVVRRLDSGPSTTLKPIERKMRWSSSNVWRIRWRADGALYAGKRQIDFVARRQRLVRQPFPFHALSSRKNSMWALSLFSSWPTTALFRWRRLQPVVSDPREDTGLAAQPHVTHELPRPAQLIGSLPTRDIASQISVHSSAKANCLLGELQRLVVADVCETDVIIMMSFTCARTIFARLLRRGL